MSSDPRFHKILLTHSIFLQVPASSWKAVFLCAVEILTSLVQALCSLLVVSRIFLFLDILQMCLAGIRPSLSLSSLESFQSRVLWPSAWASFCVPVLYFFCLYPETTVGQLLRHVTSARSSETETKGLPTPETLEGHSQSHDLDKHLPSSWVIFF